MDEGFGFALVPIFVIVFLACAGQASAPVSPPESRFVWEPGENLTFTWTNENFDGFYYDAQSRTGKESLTIKLNKIEDRSIPKEGLVYSTTVETATARYRPFGEYAVIGFTGDKYLAGYPEGKSNITTKSGIDPGRLHNILIDDDANYSLAMGSNLTMRKGYVLEIIDVNVTGTFVILSLKKDEIKVDTSTRKVEAGKNYIYETQGMPIIAVHVESVFEVKEKASVAIKGIFQVSQYETLVRKGDNTFGVMWVTNISDNTITMKNSAGIEELKTGQIINIGNIKLKVADSNTLRVYLDRDWYSEKIEHRGATGSNNFMAWDGLNYAGFWYDIASGNYSGSLMITNMTGERIPKGGLTYIINIDRLTYTNYMASVPYPITRINDKKPPGTNWSYVTFNLGGNMYIVNSKIAGILTAHGVTYYYDKKYLAVRPPWLEEDDELAPGWDTYWKPGWDTWEMGEGYTLTAPSVDYSKETRKARIVLKRNGVELDDVWLKEKEVYRYPTGENELPKLITYLDACFAGSSYDVIQLRYTWFVSDNVTQIKEGDRFGVFNVTVVEPDRMVLKNMVPIDLKAGSSINLFGNLSFFVENSNELRFYPTNMAGTQVMSEEVTVNETLNITDTTSLAAGKNERVPGFEVVIFLAALFTVYRIKGRKDE